MLILFCIFLLCTGSWTSLCQYSSKCWR